MTGGKRMVTVGRQLDPIEGSMNMFRIGIRDAHGAWDEDQYPSRLTITEEEAWALAGILSGASGLPVEGVDFASSGETIQ